jgi:hypothetical protein
MTEHFHQPADPDDAAADDPAAAGPGLGPRCFRCQSEMAQGFQYDTGYGVIQVARWVPGLPQKGWLTGEVRSSQTKQGLPITIFRCPTCGYLESYALE